MKILVDRIQETPTPHEFEATPAWWAERTASGVGASGEPLSETIHFRVEVSRLGQDLLVQGEMEGHLGLACSRCDERYRQPLREELRLLLEPAGEREPAEPESAEALAREGVCLSDDLGLGWFRGPEIHLDAFFAEAIALAFPMQPLPEVDEAGRCSVCGVDRSLPVDTIEMTTQNSPFAVLAKLRGDVPEEPEEPEKPDEPEARRQRKGSC